MINTVEIKQFIGRISEQEKAWLFGYLDAILGNNALVNVQTIESKVKKVSILFITETGNAKQIAGDLLSFLRVKLGNGVNIKTADARTFKANQLEKEECILLITSTHGDGEVPESGKKLFEYLDTGEASLKNLSFAVLALGDSSYPLYCKSGIDFSSMLEKSGAKKLLEPFLIDVDLLGVENWFESVANSLVGVNVARVNSNFDAELIENNCLSDIGSNKEVRHLAFVSKEGVAYECGDALSIVVPSVGSVGNSPRLYSIASSPLYHGNEIHLLVSVVKDGLCSNYLRNLEIGSTIDCKIAKNNMFRLPSLEKDIIMIGAGTGLAPFRGFLYERLASNSSGKNWLFFGEQKSTTDFYYQLEMQEFLASKTLTKLDLAFSRDTQNKVYVQDRILENATEFYAWLQRGAVVYVCGGKAMFNDVETALLKVIESGAGETQEFARECLNEMIESERFKKDVY